MADKEHHEIVIVKRHASHEDGHHGGAWKIAFADFMTAMMALFLVLWLISSTSDKTKHAVAQYFNPVKLVDVTTLKKGFRDPKNTEMGAGPKTSELKVEADTNQSLAETKEVTQYPGAKLPTHSEAALFRNPYAVLAEIAARTFPAAGGIGTSASLSDYASASVSWLEAQRSSASSQSSYQSTLLSTATTALSNATGVNIDQQMSQMLDLENSYAASAKLLTAVNSMFNDLTTAISNITP